jgi:hypothetical protein
MKIGTFSDAVKACPNWGYAEIQALGFEALTYTPLVCDGLVGTRTRSGYFLIPQGEEPPLVREMLAFVRLGVREGGGNNRGWGPAAMYGECAVEDCDPGDWDEVKQGAWCAATVSRAILRLGLLGFKLIGGARRLTDHLAKTFGKSEAVPGAVISWKVPRAGAPYGGHVGVICFAAVDGSIFVIEGNGSASQGRVRIYRYGPDHKYGGRPVHKISACPI